MKINEKLNFVIPLYDGNDQVYAYVHSAPVSHEVFKANFWLISKTYTALMESGLGATAGPRVASLVLADIAKQIVGRDGDPGQFARAFLAEVRRLSNAIIPKDTGWDAMPYQVAVDRGVIEPEDAMEVESAIIFFTVVWLTCPRQIRGSLLTEAALLWGARTSSLELMEFQNSLRTSTAPENTGAMAAVS